jgi:hypothetical protein
MGAVIGGNSELKRAIGGVWRGIERDSNLYAETISWASDAFMINADFRKASGVRG